MGVGNPGIIYKPRFDNGGGGFVTTRPGIYNIRNSNGDLIESVNAKGNTSGKHGIKVPSNSIARGLPPGSYIENPDGTKFTPNGYGRQTHSFGNGDMQEENNFGGRPDTDGIPDEPGYNGGVGPSGGFRDTVGGGTSDGVAGVFYSPGPSAETIKQQPKIKWTSVPIENNPFVNYDKLNVRDFANEFGANNRSQIKTNFREGQGFALDALDTELAGLQKFAPAAGDLSRSQTRIDNVTNQDTRTSQVNSVLPDARGRYDAAGRALDAQGQRAATYAKGELTSDTLDRAMELGIRSRAGDQAGFSGIGPRSSQASKISDLMSADQRFQIAQYGENLTTGNIQSQQGLLRERAGLLLAPTSYAQVGNKIGPAPEVGAGRLSYQGASMLNEGTLLTPGQAVSTEVNQRQFEQQAKTRNNEFNTSNKIAVNTTNSQGQFNADSFNTSMAFNTDTFNANSRWAAKTLDYTAKLGFLSGLQAVNQGRLDNVGKASLADINGGVTANTQQQIAANTQNALLAQAIGTTPAGIGSLGSISSAGSTPPAAAGASTPAPVGNTPSVSSSGAGGTVSGGTNINTSPSNSGSGSSGDSGVSGSSSGLKSADISPNTGTPTSFTGGVQSGSSPGAFRFAAGASPPEGLVPVSKSADGSTLAVRPSDYTQDIARFAKMGGNPSATTAVIPIVRADEAIHQATGISYHQTEGFRPMSITTSGKQVYTAPGPAENADIRGGAEQAMGTNSIAQAFGISDPALATPIARAALIAGHPGTYAKLDAAYAQGGDTEVAKTLVNGLLGKKADADISDIAKKEDPLAQQLVAGALRIGELWPKMSPSQRSAAIATLAIPAASAASGKNIAAEVIPGTTGAIAKPLTLADATSLTQEGYNGFAFAKNYRQLSALGDMVLKAPGSAQQLATIATSGGFMGFGPSGSAVPVPPNYMKKVGAQAAPHLGVGAALFNSPDTVPENYQTLGMTPEGKVIGMPKNLAHTSVMSPNTNNIKSYEMARQVADGSHPAQKLWGKSSLPGIRGSNGGSAIISGMGMLHENNVDLAGAVTAYSLFNNTMGS